MKVREPGLDICRIGAMVMITILHVNNQYLGLLNRSLPAGQYTAGYLIEYLCFCGVNCFALLSGYLLGEQKWHYDGKWFERCAGLWMKLVIWGVLLNAAGVLFVNSNGSGWAWSYFKVILCPPFGYWWYISAYFGLLTLVPLMNHFIAGAKPVLLLRVSLIFFFFFSILPIWMQSEGSTGLTYGYSTLWLAVCYVWGAVLKRFMPRIMKIKHIVPICTGTAIFCVVFPTVFNLYGGSDTPQLFMNYLSPLCVLEAVALLIISLRIKISGNAANRIITFLSVNSLGIYLFQCHAAVWGGFVYRENPPVISSRELLWRFPLVVLGLIAAGICCNVVIGKLYSWLRIGMLVRWCSGKIFPQPEE